MTWQMNRRGFLAFAGGAVVTLLCQPAAHAQRSPVLGHLSAVPLSDDRNDEFYRGLRDFGFVKGQNLQALLRPAEGRLDRLPELAADLVRNRVDIILSTGSTVAAQAAVAATRAIPIVFIVGTDPVAAALVESLSRPGRNATGATSFNSTLGPKRLELLHEILPGASKIGLLTNMSNPFTSHDDKVNALASAGQLGIEIILLNGSTERGIEDAFATAVQQRISAIQIGADAFFLSRGRQIAEMSLRYRVPTIGSTRDTVLAGGLVGYGATVEGGPYWQAGRYLGRILKGEKPSDLPVLQPTKFELTVNLKTARALGLKIPEAFLVRADEVIE